MSRIASVIDHSNVAGISGLPLRCGTGARPFRPAFSLIETAVAISILSVVLALSMTTIVGMFRVERQFAGDARHDLAFTRLAIHFRADVHIATSAEINTDCALRLADGRTIHYTFTGSAISRTVAQDSQIEQRDSFALDRQASVAFSFAPEFENRLLQMHIAPASESKSPRPSSLRPLVIEAALNIHSQRPAPEATP